MIYPACLKYRNPKAKREEVIFWAYPDGSKWDINSSKWFLISCPLHHSLWPHEPQFYTFHENNYPSDYVFRKKGWRLYPVILENCSLPTETSLCGILQFHISGPVAGESTHADVLAKSNRTHNEKSILMT